MIKFSGTLTDIDHKPLTGTVGVTFSLYKEQTGGAPLWMETQNIKADKNGRYSALLGSASAHGIPTDAFVAGEARWLGVQPSGQSEQPRVMLASVPYAMKAHDAETINGLPASAFVLASPAATETPSSTATNLSSAPGGSGDHRLRHGGVLAGLYQLQQRSATRPYSRPDHLLPRKSGSTPTLRSRRSM